MRPLFEGKLGELYERTGLPQPVVQSISGVPNLFTQLHPNGGDGKVRWKITPKPLSWELGVAKTEVPLYGEREALKISPSVDDPRASTFTFKREMQQPSVRPGELVDRWVDTRIEMPAWMSKMFSRDINTLPAGAKQSLSGFLEHQKINVDPDRRRAIEEFEADHLRVFEDLKPLKRESRDRLEDLLQKLSRPDTSPDSA